MFSKFWVNDAYDIEPLKELEEAAPSSSRPAKKQRLDSTSPEREGSPDVMTGSLKDKVITFTSLEKFLEDQQARNDFKRKRESSIKRQSRESKKMNAANFSCPGARSSTKMYILWHKHHGEVCLGQVNRASFSDCWPRFTFN